MTTENHVIVVGIGPAGMCTAIGLAKQGIKVTVIDRAKDVLRSPRAMVYLQSTCKALDELGLLDDCKKVAVVGAEYNLRFPLTGNIGSLEFARVADLTPYAYNLHFGQDILAEIAIRHFLALPNTELCWEHQLNGFSQDETGVAVQVTTPDGETTLSCTYLIGCDGVHSGVRKAMDVEFDGFTWPDVFMATNVRYDFDKHGYAPSTMIADGDNWSVIAKIDDNNLWRIAYGEIADATEEERLARMPERLKGILPDPDQAYDVVRASSYVVQQRSATSYREGRVLLAGDAAHTTNPIGGMGFTSGVQDAALLVNCLGGVIDGRYQDDALDWYAYERRRVFLEIANPTAIEFKRRTQEKDHDTRMEDEANFFKMKADPEATRGALMSIFSLSGRPYQPDWRTAILPQDTLGNSPRQGAHGGVNIAGVAR